MLELAKISQKAINHYQRVACGEPEALSIEKRKEQLTKELHDLEVTTGEAEEPEQRSFSSMMMAPYLLNKALEERDSSIRMLPVLEAGATAVSFALYRFNKEGCFEEALTDEELDSFPDAEFAAERFEELL